MLMVYTYLIRVIITCNCYWFDTVLMWSLLLWLMMVIFTILGVVVTFNGDCYDLPIVISLTEL